VIEKTLEAKHSYCQNVSSKVAVKKIEALRSYCENESSKVIVKKQLRQNKVIVKMCHLK
jgi:hypothetical protein